MIAKKVPGAAWEYMVYDIRNRLVFSQNGNMRNNNSILQNSSWEQLVDKWNWVTFHVVQFEVENDTMTGGCEATVIILGAGFRIRYNYAFEESEAGHQFEEFKKDMENKN